MTDEPPDDTHARAELPTVAAPPPEPKPDSPETVQLTSADLPDEPLLPLTADLKEAVGVPKRRYVDDDPDEPDDDTPKPRRTVVVASISIMTGLAITALIFLGRANAQRYLIACDTARVTAEQGRGFPPWGSRALSGPEWKPIALPPNAECKPRETEDVDELGKWYLEVLVERATITLTSRTLLDPVAANATSPLDTVAEQLNQALLLARSPDRRDQRKDIERLLGDVDYWRASVHLRDASTVLQEAAKQFDAAAAQRPRHVSDAAAWATFLRKLSDELHAGPNAAPTAQFPAAGSAAPTPPVPAGVALPVESGSAGGSAAPPPPAPVPNVPSGGVLL